MRLLAAKQATRAAISAAYWTVLVPAGIAIDLLARLARRGTRRPTPRRVPPRAPAPHDPASNGDWPPVWL